ncbi:hypothetical protein DPMN_034663 [Dreissena polymorpha]|uniref:Uncharacterized protein n=1 Tax=Dreissena polymorpha TaxID=45954 RepID=A0A9D4M640_DREPO|nr:hypothetical protein DPMN_034663 [Dreissena polymorpha]
MTTCNERLDLVTKDHLRKVKPIQNFPDCFRFVAEVADDFLKLFDETSDQKGKGQNTLIKTNTLLINRPPKQQLSPITKGSEPIRPKPNTKHTIASHPEQNYGVPHAHIRPVLSEKGSKQISNASIQTQKLTRSKTVSPGHRYVAEKKRGPLRR